MRHTPAEYMLIPLLLASACGKKAERVKPNIIFIMADDLGSSAKTGIIHFSFIIL